ncbi:LytTR family DNA-binding domain-containing protein [Lacimicrobium sp. SS2-24]|uniref:LytTR family DNA-binding domain-containing protein n=1 Tax=Lacimicrobium sp. SS2-24 TaxID=2005569 RepID=UPI00143B80EB|nr:LytTR family DNA-binding domain-containing protein [Lacimicrobium sp. SS2-24]
MEKIDNLQVWPSQKTLLQLFVIWCIALSATTLYCYSHGLVSSDGQPDLVFSLRWAFEILLFWLLALPVLLSLCEQVLPVVSVTKRLAMLVGLAVTTSLMGFSVQLLIWWPESLSSILYLSYQYLPKALIASGVIILMAVVRDLRSKTLVKEKKAEQVIQPGSQLLVMAGADQKLIDINNVIYVQSSGNYLELFSQGKSYLYRATLSSMAEKLQSHSFIRIHRQYLVNTRWIDTLMTQKTGQLVVRMSDGSLLPVGRNFKAALSQFKI